MGDAEGLEQSNARPIGGRTPEPSGWVAHAHRFAAFCTSDVARYRLLFQHRFQGFSRRRVVAPAVRALDSIRRQLERAGVRARHVDLWTALMAGLVDQQISNDPGGDRWIRLIDDAVGMFLAYCVNDGVGNK